MKSEARDREEHPAITEILGKTANIENAASNADLLIKQILAAVDDNAAQFASRIANVENAASNADLLIKQVLAVVSDIAVQVASTKQAESAAANAGPEQNVADNPNPASDAEVLVERMHASVGGLSSLLAEYGNSVGAATAPPDKDGVTGGAVEQDERTSLDLLSTALQRIESQLATLRKTQDMPASGELSMRLAALEAAAIGRTYASEPDGPEPGVLKQDDWRKLLSVSYPSLFNLWLKLYESALPHYSESIEASCSTWENRFAVAFRDFLRIHAGGYLLDVGSGTLACPVYLEGYPAKLVYGLDPRPAESETAFPIVVGVNEFLPFADNSFRTVCNATSLDHVIDLEKALEETSRVLTEDGRFVIWYAHLPDAPPPSPEPRRDKNGMPVGVDQFHLFHLNDAWFLPMVDRHFALVDRRVYSVGSFSHVFAAYRKR